MIKKIIGFIALILIIGACENVSEKDSATTTAHTTVDSLNLTNDFFDNEPIYDLGMDRITVEGEIENPGKVDFSKLSLHSLIVKETLLEGDSNKFIGAYRYDGYSLYDILNSRILDKKNKEQFEPIIDMYIEVENGSGEKVVFSWGEIYYPNFRHQIIIATKVTMIKPSKTKDTWPLPTGSKIVVATDLITERNIENPVRILIRSGERDVNNSGNNNSYSPRISIFINDELRENISAFPEDLNPITYPTIFYGRGRGIHSVTPFSGVMLKELLSNHIVTNRSHIQEGIVTVVANDGYRTVFTYSEIMNRNDQSEVLVVDMGENTENGRFRLFPAADFFSDRAIFAIEEIYLDEN